MNMVVNTIATFEYEALRYLKILQQIDATIADLTAVRKIINDHGAGTQARAKKHAAFARRLHEENFAGSFNLEGYGAITISTDAVRSSLEKQVSYLAETIASDLYDVDRWLDIFEEMNKSVDTKLNQEFPPETTDTPS